MQFSRYISQLLLVGVLACTVHCTAQQRDVPSVAGAGSAQGHLTATLTVVASVGIVFDSDGEPKLIEANSVSHSDNVSGLQPALPRPEQTVLQPISLETAGKEHKASNK